MPQTPQWNSITRHQLIDHANDPEVWGRVYDQMDDLLKLTARYLHHHLHVFSGMSGKDRLAHFAVRIKDRASFVTKIMDIAKNEDRRDKKFAAATRPRTMFDLVNDLVGARLVFYFERDILEALIFFMGFPLFYTAEVTQWRQDISGYDSGLPATRWLDQLPTDDKLRDQLRERREKYQKESGYESLHLILAFDTDAVHARARIAKWKADNNKEVSPRSAGLCDVSQPEFADIVEQLPALRHVRFEVQCRTAVEDVWAEVEHRARYASAKAGRTVQMGKSHPTRVFRDYKAILRAAQVFQNSIRAGFGRWDDTDVGLLGRQTNVDIGARSTGWKQPKIRKSLESVNQALKAALRASRGEGKPKSSELWSKALDTLKNTISAIAEIEGKQFDELLRVRAQGMAPEDYDKQRILVMLLAFITAYADDHRDGEEAAKCARVREDAASLFYSVNVSVPEFRVWMPPRLAPIRIYEQLSMLDEYHMIHLTDLVCATDPLVTARAASAYFRHFGSVRRSLSLLKDTQQRITKWRESKREPKLPEVLQPPYIGKRLAETYWASYHLDGRRPQDLKEALAAAEDALTWCRDEHPDFEVAPALLHKLWAHILTMRVFDAMEQLRAAGNASEIGWEVFRLVGTSLAHRWGDVCSALFSPSFEQKTSLRRQGRALAMACLAEGSVKDRANKPRSPAAWLDDARRDIRYARRRIEERAHKRQGWALPVHVDVTREIEDLIFSLCLDDQPQETRVRYA